MKRFLFFSAMLLCFIFSAVSICKSAEIDKARQWAENKGEQILQILANKNLEQKYVELDKILHEDIDLDYAARFVAGRYWRQMNEEQKQAYVPLFKRYVAALYKSFPLDIPEGSIDYNVEKVWQNSDTFEIVCTINLNTKTNDSAAETNGKIQVLFTLVENAEKIMVRDLKIAESSLLITYRERFNKMIHQDNDDEIDWFLEDLTALTEDKERENELKLIKN